MDLERRVKEQDKTINLLSERMDLLGTSSNAQESIENNNKPDGQSSCCNTPSHHTTLIEQATTDMTLRHLEYSMLQSMATFTTCTAQMNMQLQNQNTIIQRLTPVCHQPGYSMPHPGEPMIGPHPSMMSSLINHPNVHRTFCPPMASVYGAQMIPGGFPLPFMGPQLIHNGSHPPMMQHHIGSAQPPMMQQMGFSQNLNGSSQHPMVLPPVTQVPHLHSFPVSYQQTAHVGQPGRQMGTHIEAQQIMQQMPVPPLFTMPTPATYSEPRTSAFSRNWQQQNSSSIGNNSSVAKESAKHYQNRHGRQSAEAATSNGSNGEATRGVSEHTSETIQLSCRPLEQQQKPSSEGGSDGAFRDTCREVELAQTTSELIAQSNEYPLAPAVSQTDEQNASVVILEDIHTPPYSVNQDKLDAPNQDFKCQESIGSGKKSFLVIPGLNHRPPDSPIRELTVTTRL